MILIYSISKLVSYLIINQEPLQPTFVQKYPYFCTKVDRDSKNRKSLQKESLLKSIRQLCTWCIELLNFVTTINDQNAAVL